MFDILSHIKSLMMRTEMVTITLVSVNQLTQQMASENFIKFTHHESFKSSSSFVVSFICCT